MPNPPVVDCERHHTGILVEDVSAAVEFYTSTLGFELGFTWGEPVEIAGVNLGRAQIFLERGTPSPEGVRLYFVVGDADELFEFQRSMGVQVLQEPGDRPYGLRDFRVRDLHGYQISFGHYIYSVGPRIPIERVDVCVRLERRLAALLEDLAAHQRTGVGNLLEDVLLHTNAGVVPHTPATLRFIESLQVKHGIDYDSHASYRFTES